MTRVAVIGAGPAGLRTAQLLESGGCDVRVFEARDRVGGRLQTIPVGEGFFDAGGEWIDADHHRILRLLEEFGQVPSIAPGGAGLTFFRGIKRDRDDHWNAIDGELKKFEEAVDFALIELEEPPWENVLSTDLDRQTVAQFLKNTVAELSAAELIDAYYRSDEGDDLSEISLLGWLTCQMLYQSRDGEEMSSYRFPEGGQGFCEHMARRLKGRIALNSPVLRLDQLGSVHLEDSVERFDHVVLAVPPTALRAIEFEPELSQAKQDAIDAYRMGRTLKVSLCFTHRFWLDQGWSGALLSDTRAQQVWDGSRGECAVLLAYINGQKCTEIQCVEDVLADLDRVVPGASEAFLSGTIHDWNNDPYAGGGFTRFAPGFVLEHWKDLIYPEGCFHFAGEHTSRWTGFIEGALESAERVAQEIL